MFCLLNCRDCDGQCRRPLAIPFPSPAGRPEWAAKHAEGTGHGNWLVRDVPERDP